MLDLIQSPWHWSISGLLISAVMLALLSSGKQFGVSIFGLGWAQTGADPGPMFTLLGHGACASGLIILASMLGTYVYGLLRPHLPQ